MRIVQPFTDGGDLVGFEPNVAQDRPLRRTRTRVRRLSLGALGALLRWGQSLDQVLGELDQRLPLKHIPEVGAAGGVVRGRRDDVAAVSAVVDAGAEHSAPMLMLLAFG